MKTILLADSGSTKTSWSLVSFSYPPLTWSGSGLNPYFLSSSQISEILSREVFPALKEKKTDVVFFYGAGCSSEEKKEKIRIALEKVFGCPSEVEHDMLGAARAVLKKNSGIACILGTGSNACIYDGRRITGQVPSFGYLWGDYGSGSYMGKKWAECLFYNKMPRQVQNKFLQKGYSIETILSNTYQSATPNRYLASMAPDILCLSSHAWVREFIVQCLDDFFKNLCTHFRNIHEYDFGFCGSIAYYFSDFLKEVCAKYRINVCNICRDPMPGLIEYHVQT